MKGATSVSTSTQSLRDVRDHLCEVIDRVEHQHERVVGTRNDKEAAVILSPEDRAQIVETIDVLSDPQGLADIREGGCRIRSRGRRTKRGQRSSTPPVSRVPYELALTPPARRAPTEGLPEPVAVAVIDLLTTALVELSRLRGVS